MDLIWASGLPRMRSARRMLWPGRAADGKSILGNRRACAERRGLNTRITRARIARRSSPAGVSTVAS
jgi:hypothetical protein